MFRQSNSPTYNNNTRNNNNNNNRRDNYNRSGGNYRRNMRNQEPRREQNAPEGGGWETVSRAGNSRQRTYQNRQRQPRQPSQPTNSRFNSLKSSPISSSRGYKNAKQNSFSALDNTETETPRTRWENPRSQWRSREQQQHHLQQPHHQKQPEPTLEFPPLSATASVSKPAPTPVTSKPSLQGAWGKKLSDAVVTEEKFEKQVIKPKENDGMVPINLKNENPVQKSSYHKFNYKNQYNSQLFNLNTSTPSSPKLWGDYEDEEESQYYEDSYSDDDGGCDSRDNASVSDGEEYYSDDYDYRY